MYCGSISNTNVFINGRRIGGCGWNNWGCGWGMGSFSPGCFGYGFGCGGGGFEMGAGIGLGYAAGVTLLPMMPAVFKTIGQGCSFAWNKAIVPAAKWIGNGVKNLWQKIFPPKSEKVDNQK